jgi:hypothetical protein
MSPCARDTGSSILQVPRDRVTFHAILGSAMTWLGRRSALLRVTTWLSHRLLITIVIASEAKQ